MERNAIVRVCAVLLAAGAVLHAAAPVAVSTRLTGGVRQYTVRPGDSLTALGARFGTEVRLIASANGLDQTRSLVPGTTLIVDNRHVVPTDADELDVVVNVPQRMLYVREEHDAIRGFPVAVGRPDWPTPLGPFRTISREKDPVWDVPVSIQEEMRREGRPVITRMPPGPRNPLGKYWIGLSVEAVGLHGTVSPESIYGTTTHGCIRLGPDDIEHLFTKLPVGTAGALVYQPVLVAITPAGIFVEAHPDVYGRGRHEVADLRGVLAAAGVEATADWGAVGEVLRRSDGIARDVSLSGRTAGAW